VPSKLKHRVFVVDDEIVIASTLELILRNQGFDAHSFADPIAALKAAQSTPPDLLVTDVLMPQLNGIELAILIKQDCPGCKVLLLSGNVGIFDLVADAQEAGHDFAFLNKPVHPAILIERISEVLQDAPSYTA